MPIRHSIAFIFIWAFLGLAGITSSHAHDQIPGKAQERPIALVGGTVHSIVQPPVQNATVLFEDGRITAVGKQVELPPNCQRIDITGKHVYPGFIAAYTTLGLIEIGAVRATQDMRESGSINPNVRTQAAFNPDSELIPVARKTGVALAQVTPQGGRISGQSALMMLDGWTWEQMTLRAPLGLHINWPNMRVDREKKVSKKNRDEQLEALDEFITQARAYFKAQESESNPGNPHHETDARFDSMKPVLEGRVPVMIQADSIREIQAAIQWSEKHNLRLVLIGARDAWRVAELLAQKQIPVIIRAPHTLAFRSWEPYDTAFTLANKLHKAGVPFCFYFSGSPYNLRNFPYQVASAVAYGLPRDAALRAITLQAAKIFGVDDRVGSLEKGKDATLFVSDGDPLEIRSSIEKLFIQGRQVDLSSRHTQLYEKYKTKYERMSNE